MGVCAHQVGKKIKKNLRGKEKLISTLFSKSTLLKKNLSRRAWKKLIILQLDQMFDTFGQMDDGHMWTLRIVRRHMCARSCDNIIDLFKTVQ